MSVSLAKSPARPVFAGRTNTTLGDFDRPVTRSAIVVGMVGNAGPIFEVESGLQNGLYLTVRNGAGETVSVHLSDCVVDDLTDTLRARVTRSF